MNSILPKTSQSCWGERIALTSLSRELNVHRNQIQRFVDGSSVPKPTLLRRICDFFEVDARILTHPLEDLSLADICVSRGTVIPDFLLDAVEPAPQELFPDGFYEEWRELGGRPRNLPVIFIW
jgi:transcriptional regulator with XRE-family HTH domain